MPSGSTKQLSYRCPAEGESSHFSHDSQQLLGLLMNPQLMISTGSICHSKHLWVSWNMAEQLVTALSVMEQFLQNLIDTRPVTYQPAIGTKQ